jgi:hypothetical protein
MGLFRDLKKLIDEGAQQLNTKLDGHQQQGRQSGYQGQGQQGQSHRPGTVLRSHYLVQTYTPGSSQPVLVPIQWPYPGNLPQDALVFSFTHPDPASNEQTRFFLDCLPDPIGMAYHCMLFARSRLIMQGSNPPWRHRVVNISLKDEDGLAWVSGNDMTISLRWARNILSDYKNGRRDMPGCCFEFKGVSE